MKGETRYVPGTWLAVVGEHALVLVDGSPDAAQAERLWEAVRDRSGAAVLVDRLATRGLASLPTFAIVLVEDDGFRVVVRPGVDVTVTDGRRDERRISVASAMTWHEEVVENPSAVRIARSGIAESVAVLPLADGVVLADVVQWRPLFGARAETVDEAADDSAADDSTADDSAADDSAVDDLDEDERFAETTTLEAILAAVSATAATQATATAEPEPTVVETAEPDPPVPSGAVPGYVSAKDLLADAPLADTIDGPPTAAAPITGVPETRPSGRQLPGSSGPASPDTLAPRLTTEVPLDELRERTPAQSYGGLIDSVPWADDAGGQGDLDHDGMTISRKGHERPEPLAHHAIVAAVRCPAGHPNPPHVSSCRLCGAAVAYQDPVPLPRPRLGVLTFSTGEVVDVDQPIIVGRSPSAERVAGQDLPRLVQIRGAGAQEISRSHVAVRIEGWHVQVVDLGSRNGTLVSVPGKAPQMLEAHSPTLIVHGTRVDLADASFVYEVK